MSDAAVEPVQRAAIIDVYNAYAEGIDSKNWELVRGCFADHVLIDYGEISAASGGPDIARPIEDWMTHLRGVINGFDFTRHAITNHRFSRQGERIVCRAYMSADHVILANSEINIVGPDDVTTVVGEYTNTCGFSANGWKICSSRLDVSWCSGNAALFEEAIRRAAALDRPASDSP